MVKLIASDLDGTLLLGGYGSSVADAVFEQIHRLADKGVRFCPASGRQHTSLLRLFAPVADKLTYICENGAVIFAPDGKVLSKVAMEHTLAMQLCHDILDTPGCEIQISGEDCSYLCPKGDEIVHLMRDTVGNNVITVPTPEDVPEPIVKVAAYNPAGSDTIEPILAPRWREHFRTAISGAEWLDFNSTDKGDGLRRLCAVLGIPLEDVVAFGDSFNDEPMLAAAGTGYIMETASSELLERFPHHCSRVEQVLATL